MTSVSKSKNLIKTFRLFNLDYVTFESRKQTYIDNHWPFMHSLPPEIMAKAGFYYGGNLDEVHCYYCGIGLRDWTIGECPILEHALNSSSCPYMRTYKWKLSPSTCDMEINSRPTYIVSKLFQ